MRLGANLLLACGLWCGGDVAIADRAPLAWERADAGIGETLLLAVAAHPLAPSHLYAITARALYASTDGGASWETRFHAPLETRIISLAINASEPPTVLLGTDHGVYASADGGKAWSRTLQGAGEGTNRCTVVAFHPATPGRAYLGTEDGLFTSADQGQHWSKADLPLSAQQVLWLSFDAQHPDRVYLVSSEGLFIGDLASGGWEARRSAAPSAEEPPEAMDGDAADTGGDTLPQRFTTVAVDPQEPSHVYLAGSRGIDLSEDGGASWQPMPQAGLLSPAVSRVLLQHHSPLAIYAATARGVARYDPARKRWAITTQGLPGSRVNDLTATPTHLWAATDEGLYRVALPPLVEPGEPPAPGELLSNFVHEPTIAQVQQDAIRYADVHPDKIKWWRRQAALRGLLPHVNLGVDRGSARNIHVDEGSFPNFQILETRDHDAGVDLSVTWELADLIWNDAQTSIDNRSKLMVQLRDDIIDEVTRAYFERRRLQVLLLTEPPADPQLLLEKEIRIQELTALVDGLTGGGFSRRMTFTTH